jgi:hypothetical protein
LAGYGSRIHLPLFFCLLLLCVFFSREPLSAQTGRLENPRIPERVRERIVRQGSARVIVKLLLSGGGYASEQQLGTAPAVTAQRQRIGAAQRTLLDRLRNTNSRVNRQYRTLPYLALEVGLAALPALESSPAVLRIFEDGLSRPLLDESGRLVQATEAQSSGFDGTGTVVAILDTGVEKNHPFFGNRVVEEACFSANGDCPNGQVSRIGSGAAAPCTYAPEDCDHGTHVAGIAAGSGATAGMPFSGMAPGANVMAVQVFSRFDDPACANLGIPHSPCALSFDSDQIAGLERVYELRNTHNFAAANLSLGGGFSTQHCDSDPIKEAIDNLRAAGIATVIAAGNDGLTGGLSFPACVSSAVSVGGTTDSDTIAGFSNNAIFVSALAPAVAVNSSVPGGGFASFSGTSMSTAHVSGAFAVMKQAFPVDSVDDILAVLKGTGHFVSDARDPGNVINKPRLSLCSALASISTIGLAPAGYSALESAGSAQVSVTRWGGCLFNTAAVNFQTNPGGATPGLDYTTTSGTLSFGSGVASQVFPVGITNDILAEAAETVNLSLLPPGFGTIDRFSGQYSGAYSGTLSTSEALGGDLAFTVANGAVQILDPGTGTGSVWSSGAFSANGTGGLPGGSCSYSGTLTLAGDGTPQGSGSFDCTFSGGSASGSWTSAQFRQRLAVPATAVLTILDNDGDGLIQFNEAEYTFSEGRRRAVVTVTRTGGTGGGVIVNYSTSDGTASANTDYRSRIGTLTFSSGETSKTFKVAILKDKVIDPCETFNLVLSNPSGQAILGPRQVAVLRILEEDVKDTIKFSSTNFNTSEPAGSAARRTRVTVRRAGALAGGQTVQYATSNGTATASDFVAASGTLTFGSGATVQKFVVWILPDEESEVSETINLTLSNPTGEAILGVPSTAQITIRANDGGGE